LSREEEILSREVWVAQRESWVVLREVDGSQGKPQGSGMGNRAASLPRETIPGSSSAIFPFDSKYSLRNSF